MATVAPMLHDDALEHEDADGGLIKQLDLIWTKSKKGLNGVLFTLSKDSIASQRGTVLMFFIDFCQLMALAVPSPEEVPVPLSWLSIVFSAFKFSAHIINTLGYMPSLYASLVVVAITLCNVLYVGYMWSTNNFRHLWTLKMLRYFTSFLVGVGYIPILGIMAQANSSCSSTPEACVWVASFTLVFAALFVALCLCVAIAVFSSNPKSKSATARPHSRVAASRLAVRTILVILANQLDLENNLHSLAWYITLTILSNGLCYLYFTLQPFYDVLINTACVTFNAIFGWMSACRLLTVVLNYTLAENEFRTGYHQESAVFFGGVIFVLPAAVLANGWWRQRICTKSFQECSSPYQIELRMRYTVFGTHHNHSAEETSAEDMLELTLEYQKAVERFSKSSIICLFQVQFLLSCIQSENARLLARRSLIVANSRSPSLDVGFLIYKLRHELEESVGKDVDVISFVKSQRDLTTAKLYDEKCCHTLLQYWHLLLNHQNDIKSIRLCADQISKDRRVAVQAYNEYLRMNPNAVDVLKLYSTFVSVVCNDNDQARKIYQNAERLENTSRHQGKGIGNRDAGDVLNLLDGKNAVLAVTASGGTHKAIGEIVSASAMAANLLNEATTLLHGSNVCTYLAPPFSNAFAHLLQDFFDTGNDVVFNTTFDTFCRTVNEFLTPVQMRLKLFTNDGFTFFVYFVLSPDKNFTGDEKWLMIDEDLKIVGSTRAGYDFLTEVYGELEPESLSELFPNESHRFADDLIDAGTRGLVTTVNEQEFKIISKPHELPGFTQKQRIIQITSQVRGGHRGSIQIFQQNYLPGAVPNSNDNQTALHADRRTVQNVPQAHVQQGPMLPSNAEVGEDDNLFNEEVARNLEMAGNQHSTSCSSLNCVTGEDDENQILDPERKNSILESTVSIDKNDTVDGVIHRSISDTNSPPQKNVDFKPSVGLPNTESSNKIGPHGEKMAKRPSKPVLGANRMKRKHASRASRGTASVGSRGKTDADHSSVGSSEFTITSSRVRSVIRDKAKSTQPILVFSKHVIVLNSALTALLICVAYGLQVKYFGDFVSNIAFINSAGLRRALLVDLAYGTIARIGIANGAAINHTVYDDAGWTERIITAAEQLQQIDFAMFQEVPNMNDEMKYWYESEHNHLWFLENGRAVSHKKTVTSGIAIIFGKAMKLAGMTGDELTFRQQDVFTVLSSVHGETSLLEGINATTSALVDTTIDIAHTISTLKVVVTVLGLAFVSFGLMSVFFTLLYKANALHDRKIQVLDIILEISDSTLKNTISILEQRLEQVHGSIIGVENLLDNKRASSTKKAKNSRVVLTESVRNDRSLTYSAVARMSIVALIPALYFGLSTVYVDNILQRSMTQAAKYSNFIGMKRGELLRTQHYFHMASLQDAFNLTYEPPFHITWNETLDTLNHLHQVNHLHIYGDTNLGLVGMAAGNVIWGDESKALMYGEACEYSRTAYANQHGIGITYEECAKFEGGLLNTGLVSALDEYISSMRSYIKAKAERDAIADFDSFYKDTRDPTFKRLSKLNALLAPILGSSAKQNVVDTSALNHSVEKLSLYLVLMYMVLMVMSLVFVVNPQFRKLNEDVVKFRALLLLIPEDVLQDLKNFRLFMKEAIVMKQ